MLDLLAHLRADSARFRNVLVAADLTAPVPTCPTWTAADLFWHLTEVQWFWGAIVRERAAEPSAVDGMRPHRPDDDGLAGAFDYHSQELIDALQDAPAAEHVWTWSSEQSIGWVARRQSHEALIHRVDAEMTLGSRGDVDAELAADGVDEVLRIMLPSVPEWAQFEPDGVTLRLHATDVDRTWGVAFGTERGMSPDGEVVEREAVGVGVDAADPGTVVQGPAAELDLWLWGRGDFEALEVEGPVDPAQSLRHILADETR